MKQREIPAFYVAYFVKGMIYVSVNAETGAIGLHRNPHFTTLFTFRGQAEEIRVSWTPRKRRWTLGWRSSRVKTSNSFKTGTLGVVI